MNTRLPSIFEGEPSKQAWFQEIVFYANSRYPPIEERFINTFRYVELDPKNKLTFSYEYASILRDVEVFSTPS